MTKRFKDAYDKLVGNQFIKLQTQYGGKTRSVYEYSPKVFDISLAYFISRYKANETSDKDQNNIKRDQNKKLKRQFEGTFAELIVTIYLLSIGIDKDDIKWYDIERKDFTYRPNEEYDIKIQLKNKTIIVDVRSSYFKNGNSITDIFDSNSADYIPSYTNGSKSSERRSDVSIRVYYKYKRNELAGQYDREIWKDFLDIENLPLNVYIIGYAPNDLIEKNGIPKKLGQKNTEYLTIPIRDGYDMDSFKDWLNLQ